MLVNGTDGEDEEGSAFLTDNEEFQDYAKDLIVRGAKTVRDNFSVRPHYDTIEMVLRTKML